MLNRWTTCIVNLGEPPIPGHTYTVIVKNIDGVELDTTNSVQPVEIIIFSEYIKDGLCQYKMYNALINGRDCVLSQPSFPSGDIMVYNFPHNTGMLL